MKKIAIIFLATLLPMIANALAFTVNGLSYEHLGGLNQAVRLLGFVGEKCPSQVIIPATVTNDGRTYSVDVISAGAFNGCTELTSVKMETKGDNGVKYIEPNSFAGCTNLSEIIFSNVLKAILAPGFSGQIGAFEGCTALKSIDLPASMDYMGEVDATATHNICKWAFKNCTNLEKIIIRAKSPYIEDEAFINCSSLHYFVSYITQPWNLDSNTFQGIPSSATLIVPDGTKSSYQTLSGWNAFKIIKEHSDVDLNAIIGGDDQPQGGGTAKLSIEDFTIKAGETKTMLIDMLNPDDQVTLVQFDLRLPDGLSIATGEDAVDIAGRTTWKKHTLTSNATDGITRILLYSSTNAVIDGTSGAIISIKLVASSSFNGGDIKLENQLMTTPDLVESKPTTYTYNIKGGGDNPIGEAESYVVYNDGTLTFYCDNQKSSRQGTTYNLPEKIHIAPLWYKEHARDIKKTVIDKSFANVRPTWTHRWFEDCYYLTDIQGIENLNTSEVTYMLCMFADCRALESIDLSSFDVSKVTEFHGLFLNCKNLKKLDFSGFNTENLYNMYAMFKGCEKLTEINLEDFDTKGVKYMNFLFQDCKSLEILSFGEKFVSNEKTECEQAFDGCKNLKKIIFTGNIPASINSTFFEGVGTANSPATLEVPDAYKANYQAKFDGNMFFGGYFELKGFTGVNSIMSEDLPKDVYSLSGTLVKKGTKSLKSLAKGIYIVNGRKVVIK